MALKNKNSKKKGSGPKGSDKKGKRFSVDKNPFFSSEPDKRRRIDFNDGDIESEDDSDILGSDIGEEERDLAADEAENADEKRHRLAAELVEKYRAAERRKKEEEDEDEDGRGTEKEGERDTLVAQILMQEQLEESGRVRRVLASRVQQPEAVDEFRVLVKHRQSVTAVALSEDDSKGFSASKDGIIMHWDINSGKHEKFQWPSEELLKSHGAKELQGQAKKRSKHILSLAVSSDGRYLATGGLDRHVHLWDTRTRDHIQAFPGHRGPVSCLTFRQGTTELFSGSFDRTIKIWNAEDRAYINSLFGHQSEVLSIDCLRKERVMTVGRDRTMQLYKVPEESRLVFRAPMANLECCCFISNDEFLSGADDGSIELWNVVRKKPVNIVKNAHALSDPTDNFGGGNSHIIANGHTENGDHNLGSNICSSVCSWVSSVTVCRNSDLAASGAGNGFVRLWAIGSETKDIRPVYDLPLVGFSNSLAFAKSGQFLIAGVGKEPRLGRWGRLSAACNGVAVHPLKLS
ncbi:U3 small nucleolar RNA-interacting protein 2-like [Tripterygium wilfordii]|uniref:U3 small nucleolar RNA-interacting protein 2-like n=1 Tax=Tripterygium wilfordii TaxID=458696 RepID=A0A7J7CR64_TRIWF|nr:U3 snoRNP-associated protein-like EMB2271 [Tripterygium wilfordii]XP_038724216.1 U3 snoRNP-associated protein-like EMB2271 [Tripterygium wilfordii]KAF5736587.1 U3 small nucleolar RNA-interacting protein 2-like [Tripterygium wilfordii]